MRIIKPEKTVIVLYVVLIQELVQLIQLNKGIETKWREIIVVRLSKLTTNGSFKSKVSH